MKKRILLPLLTLMVVCLCLLPLTAHGQSVTDYGIYVGGVLVTPDTLSGEGWSFDPDSYTLTLRNFDVGTSAYVQKLPLSSIECNKFIIYITTNQLVTLNVVGNNLIGDEGYSSWGTYDFTYFGERVSYCYYGILGKGDNTRLRITGDGKLKIVTNEAAIDVGELDVDMAPGGSIECRSFYIPVSTTQSAVFQGNGSFTAECTSGNSTPLTYAGIYSRGDITIRDNVNVEGRIYREERTDKNAIYSKGNLNVEGGTLTGRVLLYADSDSSRTVGNGIRAKNLYISGGGMVTGIIENLHGYDLICNGYGIDGEVGFRGPGTLRYASSKKTSFTGIQAANVTVSENHDLIYSTPDSERPWEYKDFDQYGEIRCDERKHVYLWDKDGISWSYVRDVDYATAYSGELPLDKFFLEDSQLDLVVISGDHVITPDNRPNHVPPIVVEGGSLTLNMKSGKEFYKLTNPVEVKAGATLTVSGDGLLYNLQASGEGTIRFESGTVRSDSRVASSLNLVVTGGSIDATGAATAKNASGETVSKYKFHIGSGNHSIQSIRLKQGTYNATGIVPEQGYIYLWLPSPTTLNRVVALNSSNNTIQLRILSQTSSDFYQLWEITGVKPNFQKTIVVEPGKSEYVHSLYWTFQELSSDYTIYWTFSKDGGNTWEQKATSYQYSDSIVPEGKVGATAEMNGWIYRAEIRNNGEEDIAAVFEAELYVHAPTLTASQSSYNPGEDILLEVATLPVEESVRFEYTWQADFGSGYETIGTDSPTCTIPATEAMSTTPPKVKCTVRVYYTDDVGRVNYAWRDATTQELTITVEEKRPVITVQPQESTRLNYDSREECTLSITAEKADTYQWQELISGEYRDIPGATDSSYSFRANRENLISAYRCAVSNAYGTVYSQEARIEPVFAPFFTEDPQNTMATEGDSASFTGTITPGYDGGSTGGSSFWQVSKDGGVTYQDAKDLEGVEITPTKSATTPACDVGSKLVIRSTTQEMNGWYFRLALRYGNQAPYEEIYSQPAMLAVQYICSQHVWDEGRILIPPTCTESGLKLQSCTNCSEGREVPVPATGHKWQEATCDTPKTCSVCEETEGDALGHDWADATCDTPKTCSRCKKTEGDALGHDWADATCTAPKTCSRCKLTEGDPLPHSYGDTWERTEQGHCHTCTQCGNSGELEPHTPDREEATESHAVYCTVCGYEIAPPLPHEHVLTKHDAIESTCETDGNRLYYSCSICGDYFADETGKERISDKSSVVIPATGHKWQDATCDTPKTCLVCEKTEGDALGHDWVNATCDMPKTCNRCKKTEGDALGHDWVDATCTAPKTCNRCKLTEGEALPHSYGDAWVGNESGHYHTCTQCGKPGEPEPHIPDREAPTDTEPVQCTLCGYILTPALSHSHSLTQVAAVEPDCTHNGNIAHFRCGGCGKLFSDAEGTQEITPESVIRNALTHNFADATCDTPKTCTRCGETEGTALGHSFGTQWERDETVHWHECSRCHQRADAAEHSPDREAPTETQGVVCRDCGYELAKPLGHTHRLVLIAGEAPTCTENGRRSYYECSGCGKRFTDGTGSTELAADADLILYAAGHSYRWIVDQEPTNTVPGYKHQQCSVCGSRLGYVQIPKTTTGPSAGGDNTPPEDGGNNQGGNPATEPTTEPTTEPVTEATTSPTDADKSTGEADSGEVTEPSAGAEAQGETTPGGVSNTSAPQKQGSHAVGIWVTMGVVAFLLIAILLLLALLKRKKEQEHT